MKKLALLLALPLCACGSGDKAPTSRSPSVDARIVLACEGPQKITHAGQSVLGGSERLQNRIQQTYFRSLPRTGSITAVAAGGRGREDSTPTRAIEEANERQREWMVY